MEEKTKGTILNHNHSVHSYMQLMAVVEGIFMVDYLLFTCRH